MKIDKVIFAVDDNPHFENLWSVVSEVCFKSLGLKPVLFKISDKDSEFYEDKFGIIKEIKKIDGFNTGTQSQLVRMWATKYFKDQVCLISDIDMLMFNKEYFIDQVSEFDDDSIVIYCSDAYDKSRPECVGKFTDRYPICYNAAKGSTFDYILNTSCDFEEYVKRILSLGFPEFDCDEMYFSKCLKSKTDSIKIHELVRGYYSHFQYPRRIDRISDNEFNKYDDKLLFDNHYVDCHLARPYKRYQNEIDLLKSKILSIGKKEVYLIGCHTDTYQKIKFLSETVEILKNNNKQFVLSSHTLIPDFIVKESVGFVYDSVNPKFKNWELEGKDSYSITNSNFTIESPYILWGRSDYYHVGVIRLLINGLNYLKNLDYDIVHWIEYDALPLIDEEKSNIFRLQSCDFVFYGIGPRFSFNLKSVNPDFLNMNNNQILESLKMNSYAAEILIYNELIRGDKIDINVDGKTEFSGRNSIMFDDNSLDWSFFENNEQISIYFNNQKSKKHIRIITDRVIEMTLETGFWYIEPLFLKSNRQKVQIYVNQELQVDVDLSDTKIFNQIVGSVRFYSKN